MSISAFINPEQLFYFILIVMASSICKSFLVVENTIAGQNKTYFQSCLHYNDMV